MAAINLIIFGIGIVSLNLVWRILWRPTILDFTRSELLHLRDTELPKKFFKSGFKADHKIYKALQDLINGHIRNTPKSCFIGVASLSNWLKRNAEIDRYIKGKIEERFETNDESLRAIIQSVRKDASSTVFRYLVATSPVALTLLIMLCSAIVIRAAIRSIVSIRKVRFCILIRSAGNLAAKGIEPKIEECTFLKCASA